MKIFHRSEQLVVVAIMFGLLCRFAVLMMDQTFAVPFASDDARRFHEAAKQAVEDGAVIDQLASGGASSYTGVVAMVYSLSMPEPWIAKGVNILMSLIALLALLRVSRCLGASAKRRVGIAWFWAAFPPVVLSGVLLLRESMISMFLALFVASTFSRDGRPRYPGMALWGSLAVVLHGGMFAFLLGVFAYLLISDRAPEDTRPAVMPLLTAVVGALVIGLPKILSSLRVSAIADINFETVTGAAQRFERGGSAYSVPFSADWVLFPLHWWFRAVYFLLSPLPGSVRSLIDLVVFVMAAAYAYTLARLFVVTRRTVRFRRELRAIVTGLACFIFVFSLGVANSGTALRHRTKVWPVVALAVLVVDPGTNKRSTRNWAVVPESVGNLG